MIRFPLSDDAQAALARWPALARARLDELLSAAATDLQRELLARAVGAGRDPTAVQGFAERIRAQGDVELTLACTLKETVAAELTLSQRLKAEADPMLALELNFRRPDPPQRTGGRAPLLDQTSAGARPSSSPSGVFDSQGGVRPARSSVSSSGSSPGVGANLPVAGGEAFAEGLLTEATAGLGVAWRETDLDTRGGLKISEALVAAAAALHRGIPVPFVMGPGVGQHRRFGVVLQVSPRGSGRAWQLYDPQSRELVWANEADLLLGRDLPFANKVNRRLTRVVLPQPA